MSSTALKVIAAVTVALALILALIGYKVSRQYAENAAKATQNAAAPQTVAVVAVKPLAAYKAIDKDSVALVPLAVAPMDFFTNLDEVVGRVPLVDVDAGAPVTGRYFKEGNAVARIIPPGHQALSIEVNDVIAVGGFVRPGDVVDVLVYLRTGSGVPETQARVLLPSARVLAYEERVIDRPQGLKAEEGGPDNRRRVRTAVIAVPEAETTRVMLGASLGEIRLSLRGQGPQAASATQTASAGGETAEAAPAADKIVTAQELGQLKAKLSTAKAKEEDRPKVTVYRGSEVHTVTP
jgi:pilus assembly protein CpaB